MNREAAREALGDFQRYLADEIAPMMAMDSFEMLMRLPPDPVAAAARGWLESQIDRGQGTGAAEYLYHAFKKIHLLSEFNLLEEKALGSFIRDLAVRLLPLCAPGERETLLHRLKQLGETETTLSAPIQLLHRELGTVEEEQALRDAQERGTAEAEEESTDAEAGASTGRRFGVLMQRLSDAEGTGQADEDGSQLVDQLLSTAAEESSTSAELDAFLARLKEHGVEATLDQVFRALGKSLPGWTVPKRGGDDVEAAPSRALDAMGKMVTLAGSREEGAERFNELIYTAIEQLNEGHLAQAVAMFDLAVTLMEQKSVDPEISTRVLERAQGSVSPSALRRFVKVKDKHPLLRRVLRFFPVLTPEGLLTSLQNEGKRDGRKLILSLVEVHGSGCREQILETLVRSAEGDASDPHGYHRRNLVHLLRRIPRKDEGSLNDELQAYVRLIQPDQPLVLAKETLGAMAQIRHRAIESALVRRLTELEEQLVGGAWPGSHEEGCELLDRIAVALGNQNTREAFRHLAAHAFKECGRAGDRLARLRSLSASDLSFDPDQLTCILQALEDALPSKMLGLTLQRDVSRPLTLIKVLAGTPTPQVQRALEEIARRFANKELGIAAKEVLVRFEAQDAPTPEAESRAEMSGDLALFGLPNLLQSFADSSSTGRLSILDRKGRVRATVDLIGGKIAGAEHGRLRGLDAVCQLFELPVPGTFRFSTAEATAGDPEETLDVTQTMLEGLRRSDEFQYARALVPDDAVFAATSEKVTPVDDETDVTLVRSVWDKASSGVPPMSCQGAVDADAYRIRRLYAHWLERGAITRTGSLSE